MEVIKMKKAKEIQDKINKKATAGGGKVKIRPGTYTGKDPIIVKQGVFLEAGEDNWLRYAVIILVLVLIIILLSGEKGFQYLREIFRI
jgi:hypothetical protein